MNRSATMPNKRSTWPDIVFASLLMLAGLLMLRHGAWHLVHHHEVVRSLLAGTGAVVLGGLSIRQILQSRRRRILHKRRPASSRPRWGVWVVIVSVNGSSVGAAQVSTVRLGINEVAEISGQDSEPMVAMRSLSRTYDPPRFGNQEIDSMDKEKRSPQKRRRFKE